MSARTVQPALDATDCPLDLAYDPSPSFSVADSGIDDPVNDTGLGPLRGDLQLQDLQLSDELACLLSVVCEGRGEFS